MVKEILQYQTPQGEVPFREWLLSLRDVVARARVRARLDRLLLGSLGDCKAIGSRVFELRFHFGPGYRVYFGWEGPSTVVLLWGGEKGRQEKDIARAHRYWEDYLRRRS